MSTGPAMPDRSPIQRKWRRMHSGLREHQTGYVSTQLHRHLMPPSALHPKTARTQRYFPLGPLVVGSLLVVEEYPIYKQPPDLVWREWIDRGTPAIT